MCLLKLCSLTNDSDIFLDIHTNNSKCIKTLLKIVEDNYGYLLNNRYRGSLSSILSLMLTREARDRADMMDIY